MTIREQISNVAQVEMYLQKEWIPRYINKIINDSELSKKVFRVTPDCREEFETKLKWVLEEFAENINKERKYLMIKLLKGELIMEDKRRK